MIGDESGVENGPYVVKTYYFGYTMNAGTQDIRQTFDSGGDGQTPGMVGADQLQASLPMRVLTHQPDQHHRGYEIEMFTQDMVHCADSDWMVFATGCGVCVQAQRIQMVQARRRRYV